MARYVSTMIVLALAFAVTAHADIYKWVDARGTVNYTQDYGKVPQKYRKKVIVISEGEAPTAEVSETVVEPGDKGTQPEAVRKDAVSAPAVKPEQKKAVYGGKDADAWRAEFTALRTAIKTNEAELADRKARLANPRNMNRGMYLSVQADARRFEEKLAEQNGRLSALEENARRAGVPQDLMK